MIVGKVEVDVSVLAKHIKNKEEFLAYCDSLVPSEFRHNEHIINNQRYLCCLLLRKTNYVPWSQKKELLDEVMSSIRIVGYVDILIEANVIFSMVDNSKLNKYARKESLG